MMSLPFTVLSRLIIAFFPRSKRLLISWLQSSSAVILESPQNKEYLLSMCDMSALGCVLDSREYDRLGLRAHTPDLVTRRQTLRENPGNKELIMMEGRTEREGSGASGVCHGISAGLGVMEGTPAKVIF